MQASITVRASHADSVCTLQSARDEGSHDRQNQTGGVADSTIIVENMNT